MTNEEAIRTIDTMWKMLTSAYDDIADSYAVAYTMAVDALEKQIPKKPTNRKGYPDGDRDTADGCCPQCGLRQIVITPRYFAHHDWYCRDCGQAIDWGTE